MLPWKRLIRLALLWRVTWAKAQCHSPLMHVCTLSSPKLLSCGVLQLSGCLLLHSFPQSDDRIMSDMWKEVTLAGKWRQVIKQLQAWVSSIVPGWGSDDTSVMPWLKSISVLNDEDEKRLGINFVIVKVNWSLLFDWSMVLGTLR